MKKILTNTLISLLIVGCGNADQPDLGEMSLEEQTFLLKEKKEQFKMLSDEIIELERLLASAGQTTNNERIPVVTTVEAQKGDFQHFVEVQGVVMAEDLVQVTAEIPGRIKQLLIKEGDRVSKGQKIALLDLESLNKQLEELQTALELAQTVFEKQKRLWEQNIGSEIQFLEAENGVERLKKSIATLEFQINKGNVLAPKGGVIEQVFIQTGEMAGSGIPIAHILDDSRLKVEGNVPETLLKSVAVGDEVEVEFPILEEKVKGVILQIGRVIDPSNRTFKIEIDIPKQKWLKPNLLAFILINDYSELEVLKVPLDLVQQDVSGDRYIMVMEKQGNEYLAVKRIVETGPSSGGEVVIRTGINASEFLIGEGARNLIDGQKITLVD
jgi:membrane fusion protein (multidrug efflux system)